MTHFSATCSRLSQFIKEKRGLAAVPPSGENPLAFPQIDAIRKTHVEIHRPPPTTMSLLPSVVDAAAAAAEEDDGGSRPRAMELFPQRAGFDDHQPPDAAEADRSQLTIFYGGKVLVFDHFPAHKAKDLMQLAAKGSSAASAAAARSFAYVQPRKASLQRFLMKRKDRISARAPYQAPASPATSTTTKKEKEEEGRHGWLGLGPRCTKAESRGN